MKSVSRLFLSLFLLTATNACTENQGASEEVPNSPAATDNLRIETLRRAAKKNGLLPVWEMQSPGEPHKQKIGGELFASKSLSLNGQISCQDCHLDKFGSTDGLPNAVGAGATGEGIARLKSGGQIVPRNVLPLWGRGGPGFDTFFWDGKVQKAEGKVLSQFGTMAPSDDPLVVAVHLPFVELREMISDNPSVRDTLVKEDVGAAEYVYTNLTERVQRDPKLGTRLAKAYQKPVDQISFGDIGDSIAQFIRHNFRIQKTRFHKFVFNSGPISDSELRGGILFYGRGRCSACHTGPYFSDFEFHSIPMPQLGFGKNGFGNDEGRYNVTFDPADRYLFRTPPLYNATKTGPYGHSGSEVTLESSIIAHFDPLRGLDPDELSVEQRTIFYIRLKASPSDKIPAALSDREVSDLVAFISMLDF